MIIYLIIVRPSSSIPYALHGYKTYHIWSGKILLYIIFNSNYNPNKTLIIFINDPDDSTDESLKTLDYVPHFGQGYGAVNIVAFHSTFGPRKTFPHLGHLNVATPLYMIFSFIG